MPCRFTGKVYRNTMNSEIKIIENNSLEKLLSNLILCLNLLVFTIIFLLDVTYITVGKVIRI